MPRKRPASTEAKTAPVTEQPQAVAKTSDAVEQKEASKAAKPNEKKGKKENKTEKPKAAAPASAKGMFAGK